MATHRTDKPGGDHDKSRRASRQSKSHSRSKPTSPDHPPQLVLPSGVLAGITDGLATLDRNWSYTYVNLAAAAFFKTTPDDMVGKVIWERFPRLRDSRFHEEFIRAVEQQVFVRVQDFYEPLGRWCECRCYPTQEGLTVFFCDITERKRMEQSLQQANERLQKQAEELQNANEELQSQQEELRSQTEELRESEHALREAHERAAWQARFPQENPNPVLRISADGTVLYRNPAAAKLPGWACKVDQPIPQETIRNLVAKAMADGRPIEQDVELGGTLYAVAVTPIRVERYANVYGRDITDRKRAEEALRKAHAELEDRIRERTAELTKTLETLKTERQRFTSVLEMLPAYLILLTPDHHVSFANRFFRERFGDSHCRRCFEYLFNRTEPCETCETYRVFETHAPHHWEWTGPDGRIYDIHDFPFADADGSSLIMEMGIDITECKRAEEALKQVNETLEQQVDERTAALKEANERLQAQAEELQAINEELNAQTGELSAREETLRAANEQLRLHEEALRRSEERFRNVFANAATGIVISDTDRRYLAVNDRFCEITGYSRETLLTMGTRELMHPDDQDSDVATIERLFRGEASSCISDLRYIHASGSIVWVNMHVSLLQSDGNENPGLIRVVTDISERKQAEWKVRRQATILQGISRIFQEAMSARTEEELGGVCLAVAEEITQSKFGFIGEVGDQGLDDIAISDPGWDACTIRDSTGHRKPAGNSRLRGLYGRVLKGGKSLFTNDPAAYPDSIGTPPGHPPLTAFLGVPLIHEGRTIGLIAVGNREGGYSQDELEALESLAPAVVEAFLRKRAEQALSASEKKYRTLIEATNSVIVRWDRQGILRFINERGAGLLGYEPNELIGQSVSMLVPKTESTGRDLSTLTQDILDRPEQYAHNPNENVRKDGTRLWIAWTNRAITDEDGVVQEVLAVGNDITALKKAESSLRESEGRMRAILDHMPLGVWFTDSQGRIVYGNRAATEIWVGARYVGRDQFGQYKAWWWPSGKVIEPQDWAVVRAVREGQTSLNEVIEIECFDQTRKIIHNSAVPVRDDAGQILGAVILNEDITSRIRAEQSLRESEQRLRMALEGGRMGLWQWDMENGRDFWDERVHELLGLEPSVQAGFETFLLHVDKRDAESLNEQVHKSLAEDGEFRAEFRIVRDGGEIVWIASRGRVVRNASGKAAALLGVLFDITERKHMEEQLRRLNDQLEEEVQAQTEELRDAVDRLQDEVVRRVLAEGKLRKSGQMLEGFFQHTITPLAFMDRRFNFVRVNEAYARADGKTPEFFKGRNHFALYPNDENQAIFEEVVRTGRPHRARAKAFIYPDRPQQVTYWDWQLTPLHDDKGKIQYLVLNLQDATQQQATLRELEHRAFQLQKLTLELSQAEDRERRRLAEVLHDGLQQQLAAAKFHLGLLSNRAKADAGMLEIAGQLDKMLRDAIEQSRSLSHELSPAVLYQSDLGETFEWLARQVQSKHGLVVHTEVHGRVDSQSESIKAFLFRAGQEILFNAVKHAKVTEARVRLQRRKGHLWLTIADQGRGFDPNTVARAAGFGLLSIRERVVLLGGRMKIRSAPDRGSVFLIRVPDASIREDEELRTEEGGRGAEKTTPHRHPSTAARPQVLRILLVDDHKVMREGLAALIAEQKDMEIIGQAGNGREAVDLARQLEPDVIIMDVAMPVMAGDEATRRVKTLRPQTRVIALSMFEEPGVREKMLDAGAEVYLPKTGPAEGFLAAIRGPDV